MYKFLDQDIAAAGQFNLTLNFTTCVILIS